MARQADIQYIRYFTEGSAAHQVAPVIREDPYYVPQIRKRKKKLLYVDPVATLGILVAVGLLVSMFMGLSRINAIQRENQQMEQYVSYLQQEQKSLRTEFQQGYDPETIRNTALALGMVPAEKLPCVKITVDASR